MSDTSKSMPMSHLDRKILNVVPMLLVFSLGFVMGMISNSNFPNFYISFVPSMPSPALPSPPQLPVSSPSPPLQPIPPPPPSVQLQVAEVMRFLVPKSAMHKMMDEELFWWASMAPKVHSMPFQHRVPKVAFLFLTRGNLPLWPLWEMFFNGHDGLYSIYVHTDPSYTGSLPEESVFYDRIIPRPSQVLTDRENCK